MYLNFLPNLETRKAMISMKTPQDSEEVSVVLCAETEEVSVVASKVKIDEVSVVATEVEIGVASEAETEVISVKAEAASNFNIKNLY